MVFDRQQAGSYKKNRLAPTKKTGWLLQKSGWLLQTLIASSDRPPNVGACLQAMALPM
jgi:hypothetical protein